MSGKILFFVALALVVVLVASSPIKEKDIDAIIFRLAEMKNDLHREAAGNDSDRNFYSVHNQSGEEITESDKNRLLYDYFVNPIGRYQGKRFDFDEIDRYGFDRFAPAEKKNFDEIDRFGFSKRANRRPRVAGLKRNVDEIDRYGFSSLKKRNV